MLNSPKKEMIGVQGGDEMVEEHWHLQKQQTDQAFIRK